MIVLSISTISFGQSVSKLDSSSVKVTKEELKFITKIYSDYQYLFSADSLKNLVIAKQNQEIDLLQQKQKLLEDNFLLKQKEADALEPTFWDKVRPYAFGVAGFCVGYIIRGNR